MGIHKRNYRYRRITVAAVLFFCVMMQGCDRAKTIAYFNHLPTEQAGSDTQIADTSAEMTGTDDEMNSEEDTKAAVENPEETEEYVLQKYKGPKVTIIMVGDVLLHTPVAESGMQQDGNYNFDALFVNVKEEIAAADLALVNQEVIIGGEELDVTGYPSFNAPYELGDALAEAGFDVVLHATNHALDQGKKGVRNCLSFWRDHYPDMAVLGINDSKEEQDEGTYVYEQDGIRIAILNYTYGTNGIAMPSDMPYAVNLLEEERVVADIARARENADFLVVCPHWGTEYQLVPSAEQKYWTELLLEQGVDLVLGTHPHVIEPIEWIPRGDGENGMLVYYSLGNFVNWTSSSGDGIANRMVGGMAKITVGMEDGEAFIVDYGVEPLVCHLTEGTNGVTTYLLSDYTDELSGENAIVRQDSAFSREYCEELCRQVWGTW